MINLLRQGMDVVISGQDIGGWKVITRKAGRTIFKDQETPNGQAAWLAERYILCGHGIKIIFLDRSLPEFILPSIYDVSAISEWGDSAEWPSEYHAQVRIWQVAMIEMARQRGLSEEATMELCSFVLTHDVSTYSQEIKDFLLQIPQRKSELYRFLVDGTKNQAWIDGLMDDAQLDRKKLISAFRKDNPPIVYLPEGRSRDVALAQMCIWAHRQGMKDDTLLEHIQHTVSKIIRDKDLAWDITGRILERWSTPRYPGSFAGFVKRCHKGFIIKKAWVDWETGETKYGSAVAQVSQEIGCAPQTLYNWMAAGKISGCKVDQITTEQETIKRRNYEINEKSINQAKELCKKSKGRAIIAKKIAAKRGATIRTAQREIKKRLDAGDSLDNIAKDIDQ